MNETKSKLTPVAFLQHDGFKGSLLILATILAMYCANSSLQSWYHNFFATEFNVSFGAYGIAKPMLLWVNDGLMAIFFFLIGLELKREMIEGVLSRRDQVVLPATAALGGMVVPALIFFLITFEHAYLHRGWAIPTATDIAFALGIAALMGKAVPPQLRAFLLALAVLDDMGAIAIIAIFYSGQLSTTALLGAGFAGLLLLVLNRARVQRIAPYILLSVVMWVFVLKSGVHATLAGVAAAFAIPLAGDENKSPLHSLEHALHPYVIYLIVPLFAFANAGVSFDGMTVDIFFEPLVLAIALGLVLGKPIGILSAVLILKLSKLGDLPTNVSWRQMFGISCLAGIGFTMSLFIGTLSFTDALLSAEVRLGVLTGSAISALAGYLALRNAAPKIATH